MNSTICWPDKTLPVEIHCAPDVLTSIETAASDGLLAMPRVGLGVGGLLLGKRENGRIEITRSVEIACSHTLGPGFVLTPEEIEAGREAPDSDVVGWYCSKPSGSKTPGPLVLGDHDRILFDALCPQLWQVALLVRPNIGNTTMAVFGMRKADGFVIGEPQELEWPAAEEPAEEFPDFRGADCQSDSQSGAECESASSPGGHSAGAIHNRAQDGILPHSFSESALASNEPEQIAAEVPIPVSGTLFGVPENAVEERPPKERKWPLWLSVAAILLATLAAAAYFTRQYARLHDPVALIASSNWRGDVAILWNAEALSGQEQATLVLDDGTGPVHTIHLDRAGLHAGVYEYNCHPGTTTVTLETDNISGTATVKVPAAATYLPESGISK